VVADACFEAELLALKVAVLAYAAQLDADVALVTCTCAVAPDARLPKLQVSVPLAIEQLPGLVYAGLMLQLIPVPVGKVSLSVAAVAVPAPVLLAVSVYPIDAPAVTDAASPVFVRLSAGHCTVVVADDCTELPLLALNVAVLAYAAQFDPDVALVTCTCAVAPNDRLPKLQFRAPLAIEHVPGPPYAGLMLQLIPVPVGKVSLSVAAVAVPTPVLPAVSVYPIDAPAVTVDASAVFVRLSAGHCTVVVADACIEAELLALKVAVLAYDAQLDADVALITCTWAGAPDARLPKLQFSVPLAIEHVPGPPYAGLMLQPIPVPAGKVSLSVADVAAPAPVLLAVSVYPIDEPAVTVAASAVFVRFSAGHCTVMVADDCTEAAFAALAVAVLA
jgi:predicted ATPase